MKHIILRKVGSALLITGVIFALPAYAEMHGGTGAIGMGEKGTTDAQQMSGMMHDMSGEMIEMSGMMDKGLMNPDAMKKMGSVAIRVEPACINVAETADLRDGKTLYASLGSHATVVGGRIQLFGR